MVSHRDIGESVLYVVVVALVLGALWPYMPKTGPVSELTWTMKAVAAVVLGFIVIGPGRVAWDMLVDDGW